MPDAIGPYRLHEEIGRGGMSIVYAATDSRNNRRVALKVLPPEFAHNPVFLNRFVKEGESAVKLQHSNIVRTYEASKAGHYHYIAMELAQKGTLSDRMKQSKGMLSEGVVVDILRHAAAGLDYAHGLGIVHRDIKPSNIIFAGDGRAMIADFGVAKELTSEYTQVTTPGFSVGTPAYMSPEQARGDMDLDRRADIYSLGVVAYALLTGKMPFEAPSQLLLLRKIVDDIPPPADAVNPHIHPGAAYVLHHVLAKDPNARYQSAGEFVAQLAAALEQPRWESAGGQDATVAMIPLTAGSRPPTREPSPPPAYQPSRRPTPPPAYAPSSAAGRQPVSRAPSPPARRRWPLFLVGVVGLLVIGLLAGVYILPSISPARSADLPASEATVRNPADTEPTHTTTSSGQSAAPDFSGVAPSVGAEPSLETASVLPSELAEPVPQAILSDGLTQFIWLRQEELAPDEALELVFWSATSGQEGWQEGIVPAGLRREGDQDAWQVEVDMLTLPRIYGQALEPGAYLWGIVRVQLLPDYRRLELESEARPFTFQPSVADGNGMEDGTENMAGAVCTGPLCGGR